MLRNLLDATLYSSVWLAATAAALCAAATLAMGGELEPELLALAASGTLVVYNVDRLRDLERDHATRPQRTLFISRWRHLLFALAAAAALISIYFVWTLGPGVAVLLAPAAALGLAHRRLKRVPYAKGPYIAAAWLLVVVGLPWQRNAPFAEASDIAWISASFFCAILANAMASSARDDEAAAARFGRRRVLRWARGLAAVATLGMLLAPEPPRNVLPIPGLTWLALLKFRDDERYGLLILDGALLVGATIACALLARL